MTHTGSRPGASASRVLLLILAALVVLEAAYLAFSSWLLPARLAAFAERHRCTVTFTRFASFYPGDLRVQGLELHSRSLGLTASTGPIRGRFRLMPLLHGSFELTFIRVERVEVRSVAEVRPLLTQLEADATHGGENVHAALGELPLDPASPENRLKIGHAELTLVAAQLGAYRLRGKARLLLDDVELSEGERRANATLAFGDVSLERDGSAGSRARLDGQAKARLLEHEPASGLTCKVSGELHWKSADLAALLARPSLNVESERGTLRFDLERDATTGVRPGSSLSLRSPATRLARVRMRELRAEFRFGAGVAATGATPVDVELESPHVTFDLNGREESFSLKAESRAEFRGLAWSGLALGQGTVHATRIADESPVPGSKAPLQFELALQHAAWAPDSALRLRGDASARGGDAQALLELAQLGPSAAWLSGEFSGRPFTAEWALNVQGTELTLQDIRIHTPRVDLRGALYLEDGSANGAFLVKRGALNLGLEVRGGVVNLELRADPAWLESSLRQFEVAKGH